jgi:hypothetical protein
MVKTIVKQVPSLKVTVKIVKGSRQRTSSKICRQARVAATFYTIAKNDEWWSNTGHLTLQPNRYAEMDSRYDRLYRRALKVFKQYLP